MANAVIGALRVNLGLDSAAFQDGLKNAQSRVSKFGGMLKTGLVAGAAAAGAALGSMAYAVKNTIDAADDMSKAASKIGIPIEELSRLKYAADLAGVSFAGLQTGVKKLSQNMNDALAGTGEGAKAFAQLGVSVANADGSLRSSTAVMADLADKFAAMPDGAEKTALAMDLMGKSGTEMIPLLNGGAEALNKLLAEADTFGQVFTEGMGKSAEEFNDNLSRLQGIVGNLAAKIAIDMMPHLEKFSAWLVENAPTIRAWADTLMQGVGVVIQEFVRFGQDVTMIVNDVRNAWAALQSAWDETVARVSEIVAAVKAMAAEIVAAFKALPGQMIAIGSEIIAGLWQGIQNKWESVKAGITGLAGTISQTIKDKLGIQSPSKVMHEVGTNIAQGLADGMDDAKEKVKGIADSIGSTVIDAFFAVVEGTKTVKDAIMDVLKSLAKLALNSAFNALFSGGAAGGGMMSSLVGGIGKLFGFARGGTILPGGAGGIDSQLVMFRKSPNERVDITKPGQMLTNGSGSKPVVNVYNYGNDNARTETRPDGAIDVIIGEMDRRMADGRAGKGFAQRYGLQANTIRR